MRSAEKLTSLDALRGALSLIVLFSHSWQTFLQPVIGHGTPFGFAARLAVLCFFSLSGFVITMSLHANRARNGRLDLVDYASARVFRIVPPLLVVIAFSAIAQLVLLASDAYYVDSISNARLVYMAEPGSQLLALISVCVGGDLTGQWSNGPLWSLEIEIRLYVVAGLVACLVWLRSKPLAAMALVVYLVAVGSKPEPGLQALCFFAFGLGSAAYFLRTTAPRAVVILLLCSVALAVLLASFADKLLDLDGSMLPAQAALSIAAACLVLLVGRMQASGWLLRAGGYSYTLYIGHFPLLLFLYFVTFHFAPDLLGARWVALTAVCALAITWTVLAQLGRWVERPKAQRAWCRDHLRRWRIALD